MKFILVFFIEFPILILIHQDYNYAYRCSFYIVYIHKVDQTSLLRCL